MGRTKKAKTLKQFKKSNKKFYTDLMSEKAKHAKASRIIGEMKQRNVTQLAMIAGMARELMSMRTRINEMEVREDMRTEHTADIISELHDD